MTRRTVIGPRQGWPPPTPDWSDRNGEPVEMDYGCMALALVSVMLLVGTIVLTVVLVLKG